MWYLTFLGEEEIFWGGSQQKHAVANCKFQPNRQSCAVSGEYKGGD